MTSTIPLMGESAISEFFQDGGVPAFYQLFGKNDVGASNHLTVSVATRYHLIGLFGRPGMWIPLEELWDLEKGVKRDAAATPPLRQYENG